MSWKFVLERDTATESKAAVLLAHDVAVISTFLTKATVGPWDPTTLRWIESQVQDALEASWYC